VLGMKLFEVFLNTGVDGKSLLSPEVLQSTGAQVFSPREAELVGLEGIPEDPQGRARVLIACAPADERLIATRLEAHDGVGSFKLHQL
jgi:hypothetical protein